MLAEAAEACEYAADPQRMLAAAQSAWDQLAPDASERARCFANLALGMALIYNGRSAADHLRDATALLEANPTPDPRLLALAAQGALWLREAERGRALVTRAIESARAAAAVGALPFSLWIAGRDAATSDRLAVAIALYEEAIRLARETGQATALCAGLSGLACVEARLGRADACREHAAEALAETAPLGVAFFRTWAFDALAEIELGLGDVQEAVKWLESKERLLAERGIEDPDSSPVPELVEALVRLDRAQEAAERLEPFANAAEAKGQPWSLARLARCRGLLGDDAQYAEALELHQLTPDRFEEARTQLCHGEALRRARQRVKAREHAPRRRRGLRRARRRPVGRARAPRAAVQRRDRPPPRRADARRAHPARAAGRARAGRGPHDPRDGREAVPQPEDRRPPPAARLPQARDRLPDRPGRGAPADSGAPPDASPREAPYRRFPMTLRGAGHRRSRSDAEHRAGRRRRPPWPLRGARGRRPAQPARARRADRHPASATSANGSTPRPPAAIVTHTDGRYTLPDEHAATLAELSGTFREVVAIVRGEDGPRMTCSAPAPTPSGRSSPRSPASRPRSRPAYAWPTSAAATAPPRWPWPTRSRTPTSAASTPNPACDRAGAHANAAYRARFDVATAQDFPGRDYALITTFDCLHDEHDPVAAARHIREALAPDGRWLIVEPFAGDSVEDNLTPVGRVYYALSTLVCMQAPTAHALGAQAGEARLRDVVVAAGFTHFSRVAVTPFNVVLEARP